MTFRFSKYHGTGNDFVLIDNRAGVFNPGHNALVKRLCDRRTGIGADGLMLLQESADADFEMVYYNADGKPGSLCGNGGRCITLFAKRLGLVKSKATFIASDGRHESEVLQYDENSLSGTVSLKMNDVKAFEAVNGLAVLDTGSPHYVRFVDDVGLVDVVSEGRKIRYLPAYAEKGINVNFVSFNNGTLRMRTYERGVEDETLSCGTGAVAAALAASALDLVSGEKATLLAPGGELEVRYASRKGGYADIYLSGPATWVFDGTARS